MTEKPSDFVENFIGQEPFDYQSEFMDNSSKRKVFVSGRRVGKSRTATWLSLWRAVTTPSSSVLVLTTSRRQSLELLRMIKKEIKKSELSDEDFWENTSRDEIVFSNGSRIILSFSGRVNLGKDKYSADFVIVDEAAFVQDKTFDEILDVVLKEEDGHLILLSTPFGEDGFFYDKANNSNWYKKKITTSENPEVSSEIIEQQRESLPEYQFEEEYLAKFSERD